MLSKQESFIKTLESLTEEEISSKLFSGGWSVEQKRWASDWLDRKASLKRDAREEETLSIAKDANRIASNALTEAERANRSRWKDRTMTIIAIIIATIAARADIKWFISWLVNILKTP
jgi:hypothetical protein